MKKVQYDFKKELEKTKNQLIKFSKEAAVLAKKGEKEFIKFSKRSKVHLDSTAVQLKKEHLFYLIGKEYTKSSENSEQGPKMRKLMDEFNKVDKQQRALRIKLKTANK